jgi:hypothetical protein
MDMASIHDDPSDDPRMGFGNEKWRPRGDRFRSNVDRIGIQRKGSCGGLRKHMEKGPTETLILMPFFMSGKVSPLGRPVSDEFMVFCRGGCGKMGDPRIDPSDGIRDIGTVDRYFMADEEILREIGFNPLGVTVFLFNGPPTLSHHPNLKGRFLDRFSRCRCGDHKRQEKNEGDHIKSY